MQHVPFEGTGSIAAWLSERNAQVTRTSFFESAELPELKGLDLIIAMGGPMSVNDEDTLPWMKAEKQFIRDAIRLNVPVLGICLGAQLIANAIGSRVYGNREKEIGWFEIESTPSGKHVFRFPPKATVFHWHGETFDLPPGSVRLARSAACANQAFQMGDRVIGLQFHLEMTPESIDSIIHNCRHELTEAAFVQTEPEMRSVHRGVLAENNRLMGDILSYVTRK